MTRVGFAKIAADNLCSYKHLFSEMKYGALDNRPAIYARALRQDATVGPPQSSELFAGELLSDVDVDVDLSAAFPDVWASVDAGPLLRLA